MKKKIEQIFGGGARVLSLCLPFNTGVSPEAERKNARFPRCLARRTERGEWIE